MGSRKWACGQQGSSFDVFVARAQSLFVHSLPCPATTRLFSITCRASTFNNRHFRSGSKFLFPKIQMVPTWLSASICSLCCRSSVTVAPCSPSRSGHLAGFKYLSRYIHFVQGKYQQRLCFILFVNSLSIGWLAWDSASMRRIESAFFKRVRRSSGDRSSTWVQLIVYNIYTLLYILGRINPAMFS